MAPASTTHVQVRVPSELLDEMVAEAARVGVYVSEWARDAVIGACARKAVPAKVPQPSGGKQVSVPAKVPQPSGGKGRKISIRFRSADHKTIEVLQQASGLKSSDFFRECFVYVLKERIDVSRPSAFVDLRINGEKKRVALYGGKKRRKKKAAA